MELYDLNIQILDSIFTGNINQQILHQYMEWHQNIDPSFKCLKNMLNQYLSATQSKMLKTSANVLLSIIQKFTQFKFPRTFVRAYLSILQQNFTFLQKIFQTEKLKANWRTVNIDILECYLQAFRIQLEGGHSSTEARSIIPIVEIEEHVNDLIEKKDYESAIKLIKLLNYPSKYLQTLFDQMGNNKQASKAANFMKSHGIDSTLYPQINKRLSKNMIRYFLSSVGWDAAQEIFCQQADALWNLIQNLMHKKKQRQAKSVWFRNKDILSEFTSISEELQKITKVWESESAQFQKQIIFNPYFIDQFGPSDKQKYLTLEELGVAQKQVYFLTRNEELIEQFVRSIEKAYVCAIDTESIVGKTKLDRKKQQPPSIIQVALQKEIYIIDCFEFHPSTKKSLLQYLSSGKLLLGHALQNDLEGVLLGLGLNSQERKLFKFGNVVDTCKLFKQIYPKEKHSNLSHISLKVLKRQICKKQTLTNWARRPLRRNQIHYAALDALCVIHIYKKLEQDVGPNMLSYFLEQL